MSIFSEPINSGVKFLYYSVDDKDFANIVSHQYKQFPIRFFNKENLCPVLNPEYARRIAAERSNWSSGTGFVHTLRFLVRTDFLKSFIKSSAEDQARIIVPKQKLQQFNQGIVGYIERIWVNDLNNPANQLVS